MVTKVRDKPETNAIIQKNNTRMHIGNLNQQGLARNRLRDSCGFDFTITLSLRRNLPAYEQRFFVKGNKDMSAPISEIRAISAIELE